MANDQLNETKLALGRDDVQKLIAVRETAEQVCGHIGCYGEIDSRNPKVLALLNALYDSDEAAIRARGATVKDSFTVGGEPGGG